MGWVTIDPIPDYIPFPHQKNKSDFCGRRLEERVLQIIQPYVHQDIPHFICQSFRRPAHRRKDQKPTLSTLSKSRSDYSTELAEKRGELCYSALVERDQYKRG